jgi:hypothetical protein
LAYGDDVVIMGSRLQYVEVFTSLVEQTYKMGLEVNGERGEKRQNESVKLGTYNFEIVKDYTYLGSILTNKN